jgi:hypothetical protein
VRTRQAGLPFFLNKNAPSAFAAARDGAGKALFGVSYGAARGQSVSHGKFFAVAVKFLAVASKIFVRTPGPQVFLKSVSYDA